MRFAIGSDERSEATDVLLAELRRLGHQIVRAYGPISGPDDPAHARGDEDWLEVGRGVAEAVARGDADQGIVCCWTGTGVSIAANKVAGIRAALCGDAETAAGARRWNDANVLALSIRTLRPGEVAPILDAWLSAEPDDEERDRIAALG